MFELFVMGGVLFMSVVTIGLILVLVSSVRGAILIFGASHQSVEFIKRQLSFIKSSGLFAAVCGVLGQMIGLYSAFEAIEEIGQVAPAMLAGGLKVSSITTIYGLIVCVISILIWLALSAFLKKSE